MTPEQLPQLAALLGEAPEVRDVAAAVDRGRPLAEVAVKLADAANLTPVEWQTLPLLLNPPALAPVALALIAELYGRCGYFPAVLNVRPVAGALPPRYEVAEIANLQALREEARGRRQPRYNRRPSRARGMVPSVTIGVGMKELRIAVERETMFEHSHTQAGFVARARGLEPPGGRRRAEALGSGYEGRLHGLGQFILL